MNDNLTNLTTNFNSTTSNSWTLIYDANNQLTKDTVSDSSYMWHPSAGGTTTYSGINNLNQYGSVGGNAISYDKDGNLLTYGTYTFSYDTQSQLTQAINGSTTVNFEYDPLMRQVIKNVTGGNDTRFLYSGSDQIIDYNQSTGSLINHYIYGNSLIASVDSTGAVTYNHEDQSGSVIATTNSSGTVTNQYSYSPFGESSTFTASGFGYTGQRFDSELGLYYLRARYYYPSLGRFLQPDPIGYSGGLNLYTYVVNDPLNLYDIFGLEPTAYLVYHPVAHTMFMHLSLLVTDPDIENDPKAYTISAGPSGKFPFLGKLIVRSGNLPNNAPINGSPAYKDLQDQLMYIRRNTQAKIKLIPPVGVSEAEYIARLNEAAQLYQNNIQYSLFPHNLKTANSNTFAKYLINHAGGIIPTLPLPVRFPGWTKTLPGYSNPVSRVTSFLQFYNKYKYFFVIPPIMVWIPNTDIADDPIPPDDSPGGGCIVLVNPIQK